MEDEVCLKLMSTCVHHGNQLPKIAQEMVTTYNDSFYNISMHHYSKTIQSTMERCIYSQKY